MILITWFIPLRRAGTNPLANLGNLELPLSPDLVSRQTFLLNPLQDCLAAKRRDSPTQLPSVANFQDCHNIPYSYRTLVV